MTKISSNTPGVSNFVKMEVAEIRSVIKYFVIKGLKQKKIMMNCVRLWVMHALRKQQYTNGLDYSSAAEGVFDNDPVAPR